MNKAAFLDRDGVINRKSASEDEYITRWEEMQILPGVSEGIRLLNQAGFLVIVISNQRCIAKGLLSTAELDVIHRRLCSTLLARRARIDAIYYCPHEENPPCGCRKPEPGMLFAAAQEHAINLQSSWMIGDSTKDVEAGKRAGCKTARIVRVPGTVDSEADLVARSLREAAHQILRIDKPYLPARKSHQGSLLRATKLTSRSGSSHQ